MKPWKLVLIAFGSGVLGMLLLHGALVLYGDHRAQWEDHARLETLSKAHEEDHQRVTAMWQAMTQPRPVATQSPPEK